MLIGKLSVEDYGSRYPHEDWGQYKRTLIAVLSTYPGGAGVHKGAGVDMVIPGYPWRLVYSGHSSYIFNLKIVYFKVKKTLQ